MRKDNIMIVDFEEIRKNLIGLGCCYIRVGYGGKLRIGLGDKIYYKQPRLQGKFYGEWDISSVFCSWRISECKTLLCGYDDEIKVCNEAIDSLSLGCIIEVMQLSYFDIRIVFDTGVIIDYFLQSTDGASLIILGERENIAYELFWDGWKRTDSEKSLSKLTKIEELLSSLSKNCNNRWASIVTQKESNSKCNECFYFRGLDGHFYFWDYGICSNGDSLFDGKLVSVESGCNCHKTLKELLV